MVECLARVVGLIRRSGDTRIWGRYIEFLAKGCDAIYAYERYREVHRCELTLAQSTT
jgi:hypothetical protein